MGELVKPLTPHEIYEKLTTGDTRLLQEGQRAAAAQAVTEGARFMTLTKQASLLQSGWQGSAADAASGVVKPLLDNAHVGADQLFQAQRLMDQQSEAFHRAANSVRPVAAEPPRMEVTDFLWPFVDYERQVTDYQADAQHNIEVFRGYDTASEGHESGMKTYTIVDDSGGDISVKDTGDYIEVPDGGQPRGGGQFEPFSRRDPGSGPGGSPGPVPVSGPGPGVQQAQQTSPSDFVPRPAGPVPGGLPVPAGQVPGGPTPGGFVPVGGFPVGGPGARGGSPGAGEPSGRGPGIGESSGRRPGVDVRGFGAGAGALAAEEAAARRAAAAAGRGTGAGMMGGAPVGARGKGEDDEHQRKVLIEADAEGLFGSDVLTAPQVIGDDEYEDD